jgi:pimeloyl-ACP methyl ester carboxylesterase
MVPQLRSLMLVKAPCYSSCTQTFGHFFGAMSSYVFSPIFVCVCFDAPGTGQSDRRPASNISLERASRSLTAVIKVLDLRDITLVFHDRGGPTGIAGPARVADRIRALVGVNTFAWKPTGVPFRGMLALMGSTPMREIQRLDRTAYASNVKRFRHRASHGRIRPQNVLCRRRPPGSLGISWVSAERSQI